MIRDAINRICELAGQPTVMVGDIPYWTAGGKAIHPPEPAALTFATLEGLALYATKPAETVPEGSYFTVGSPGLVYYMSPADPLFHRRAVWARAQVPVAESLEPDTWYPLEDFAIKLQAQVMPSTESGKLLRILGNVTDETAATAVEDGVTQKVVVKQGVALRGGEEIKNPVTLAPYRTFREVEQPESPFIVRLRGRGNLQAALFEADGGAWQVEAIENVGAWLREKCPNVLVLT